MGRRHARAQELPLLAPEHGRSDAPRGDGVGEVDAVTRRVLLRRIGGRVFIDRGNEVENGALALASLCVLLVGLLWEES